MQLFSRGALFFALLGTLYWFCFCRFVPPEPLKPGPDTTIFTGPLNARGFVDFGRALNARRGQISPGDNAAIPLIAVGEPGCLPKGPEAATVLGILGLSATPTLPVRFVRLETFVGSSTADSSKYLPGWTATLRRRAYEPWTASACPELATFIATNSAAFMAVHEASRRRTYFWPALPDRQWPLTLGTSLFRNGVVREALRGLSCRAMLRLASADYQGAWTDLSANLRIGGLFTDQTFILPVAAGLAQLNEGRLAIRSWIDAVAALPASIAAPLVAVAKRDIDRALPVPDVGRALEDDVRINAVANANDMAQGRWATPIPVLPEGYDIPTCLDFNLLCRLFNAHADSLARALAAPTTLERIHAVAAFEAELEARAQNLSLGYFARRLLELKTVTYSWRKGAVAAGYVAELLTAISTPKNGHFLTSMASSEAGLRIDRLALDLLEYRWRCGWYPATLADLGLASTTATFDCLASASFVYRREGNGYLLYGVGYDLVDGGGVEDVDPMSSKGDLILRMTH